MAFGLQTKRRRRIFAIIGCFAVCLVYTVIFRQIIRFDDSKVTTKNFDMKQETYEIDQRVSVCFKDVVPFSMLLKQDANVCRNAYDLLVVVQTDPSNFKLRNEFRKTLRKLKNEATIYNLRIDAIFVLGLDNEHCISSLLLREMSAEKDTFIGGFIDSSENQTMKSVTMMKWFDDYCSNTKLLLKLDGRMDPYASFSMKQFYHLVKNLKNRDIVLLGSMYQPVHFLEKIHDKDSSVTVSYSYPGSPQHLHLNYLLSRNVVISLLKARADAINISTWKEDLFVTGVLAHVAQIRPEHDERFLRQCAGTWCIFCECFLDVRGEIHLTRPYYSAHNMIKDETMPEVVPQSLSTQYDPKGNPNNYVTTQIPTTTSMDQTVPVSVHYEADTTRSQTYSDLITTLVQESEPTRSDHRYTTSDVWKTTNVPSVFTENLENISTSGNERDSSTFTPLSIVDTTTHASWQLATTDEVYTATHEFLPASETQHFGQTTRKQLANDHSSAPWTESLEENASRGERSTTNTQTCCTTAASEIDRVSIEPDGTGNPSTGLGDITTNKKGEETIDLSTDTNSRGEESTAPFFATTNIYGEETSVPSFTATNIYGEQTQVSLFTTTDSHNEGIAVPSLTTTNGYEEEIIVAPLTTTNSHNEESTVPLITIPNSYDAESTVSLLTTTSGYEEETIVPLLTTTNSHNEETTVPLLTTTSSRNEESTVPLVTIPDNYDAELTVPLLTTTNNQNEEITLPFTTPNSYDVELAVSLLTTSNKYEEETIVPLLTTTSSYNEETTVPLITTSSSYEAESTAPLLTTTNRYDEETIVPLLTTTNSHNEETIVSSLTTTSSHNEETAVPSLTTTNGYEEETIVPLLTTTNSHNEESTVPLITTPNSYDVESTVSLLTNTNRYDKETIVPLLTTTNSNFEETSVPLLSTINNCNKETTVPVLTTTISDDEIAKPFPYTTSKSKDVDTESVQDLYLISEQPMSIGVQRDTTNEISLPAPRKYMSTTNMTTVQVEHRMPTTSLSFIEKWKGLSPTTTIVSTGLNSTTYLNITIIGPPPINIAKHTLAVKTKHQNLLEVTTEKANEYPSDDDDDHTTGDAKVRNVTYSTLSADFFSSTDGDENSFSTTGLRSDVQITQAIPSEADWFSLTTEKQEASALKGWEIEEVSKTATKERNHRNTTISHSNMFDPEHKHLIKAHLVNENLSTLENGVPKAIGTLYTTKSKTESEIIRAVSPKRRVKVRISPSTSEFESRKPIRLSVQNSYWRPKVGVRITSSVSVEINGKKKTVRRKLRRKRRMKKIVVRLQGLSIEKTSEGLKIPAPSSLTHDAG